MFYLENRVCSENSFLLLRANVNWSKEKVEGVANMFIEEARDDKVSHEVGGGRRVRGHQAATVASMRVVVVEGSGGRRGSGMDSEGGFVILALPALGG